MGFFKLGMVLLLQGMEQNEDRRDYTRAIFFIVLYMEVASQHLAVEMAGRANKIMHSRYTYLPGQRI